MAHTLAYPMNSDWIAEYGKGPSKVHFTHLPNGSGSGIRDLLGTVDFAGTESPDDQDPGFSSPQLIATATCILEEDSFFRL